VIPSSIQ